MSGSNNGNRFASSYRRTRAAQGGGLLPSSPGLSSGRVSATLTERGGSGAMAGPEGINADVGRCRPLLVSSPMSS